MLYRFFALLVVVCFSGFAWADGYPKQIVTSEVFYDYGQKTQKETVQQKQQRVEPVAYTTEEVSVVKEQIPVWPIAGTEADFRITCKENQGCDGTGVMGGTNDNQVKIVSKIGNGLVIENNINTQGTGWSGGPDIMNGTQAPAGFDYECVNSVEMPLMNREMMEDDGGTVLSMSRSSRRLCNKQPDAYAMFAQRAGFTPDSTVQGGTVVAGADTVSSGNETVDEYNEVYEDFSDYTSSDAVVNAENQVRSWVVASGQTLREVLTAWCDKEGWDLVWNTPREYPIEASAVFRGRFVDVASALVRNFERATPIPYAKFYKGNRVVVVSTMDE